MSFILSFLLFCAPIFAGLGNSKKGELGTKKAKTEQNALSPSVRLLLEDPRIPPHCKRLVHEREALLTTKRKLNALFMRNRSLLKITKPNQKLLGAKLRAHKIQTEESIIKMEKGLIKKEEQILFAGCPGYFKTDVEVFPSL